MGLTSTFSGHEPELTSPSFQQVQGTLALGASLRVLPSLIAGALTNISTGIFVNRMPVLWAVLISSVMSTVAPLLMALIRPDQVYWENAFFAQVRTLPENVFIPPCVCSPNTQATLCDFRNAFGHSFITNATSRSSPPSAVTCSLPSASSSSPTYFPSICRL